MKMGILLFLACFTLSCESLRPVEIKGVPVDPRVRAEQEGEIQKADQAFEQLQFSEAEKLYSNFQKQFPTSIFFQRAQFGLARSLEHQDRWSEAAEMYRRTLETTRSRQPEIAAQALFQLSFCYENLGDEARVLSSLKDAMVMKEHLQPEQALAEIPARLAASYNRMGDTEEAQKYFRQAQAGIQQVRAARNPENLKQWLSKTYFHMGFLSTNQLAFENLQPSLDTLKMIQTFALRSAEADGEPWAKRAADGLVSNYRDLWRTIQQIPMNKAMDLGAAKRELMDRQTHLTGQLLALINELKVYASPVEKESSSAASELFGFLNLLEKQAKDFLYTGRERNPLTPEAEKRGGLKR